VAKKPVKKVAKKAVKKPVKKVVKKLAADEIAATISKKVIEKPDLSGELNLLRQKLSDAERKNEEMRVAFSEMVAQRDYYRRQAIE
jgi:hypothetical protein